MGPTRVLAYFLTASTGRGSQGKPRGSSTPNTKFRRQRRSRETKMANVYKGRVPPERTDKKTEGSGDKFSAED